MGILGMILGLLLLIILAFRSWSILLLAPAAALVAAFIAGEPLLAELDPNIYEWCGSFSCSILPFIFVRRAIWQNETINPLGKYHYML